MPNPASSGTGYLTIAAWLQIMGEEAGWKFMDALHQNIAQYIHSGSAPCVQAAKGERLIGIGFDMRGATREDQGRADRPDRARRKAWAGRWRSRPSSRAPRTSTPPRSSPTGPSRKKANELYAKYYAIVAYPGREADAPPNYPPDGEKAMVKNDVEWMAKNRDRILAEWTKRYDGKSAPKAK